MRGPTARATQMQTAATLTGTQLDPSVLTRDRPGAREQLGRAIRRAEARARRADTATLREQVSILRDGINEVYALLREHRAVGDRDQLIQALAFVDWALALAAEADDLESFRSSSLDLVQIAWALERP
jgi:hypothetical protein